MHLTNKPNCNYVPHPLYGAHVTDSGGQLAEAEIRSGFWAYRDAILFPQSALLADTSKQHYCLYPRKYYVDIAKVCRDCQRPFLFFAKQQQHWFETLGFYVDADCVYPSNSKMRSSAGDKIALGKAAVGSFSGSKATAVNAAQSDFNPARSGAAWHLHCGVSLPRKARALLR